MRELILEACIESPQEAQHALQRGAHQLEVCSHLDQDGLTPDTALLENLDNGQNLPMKIMIRCRPGNFVYSAEELKEMAHSVALIRSRFRVDGFVFGALASDEDGNLMPDTEAVRVIADASGEVPLTFHKAIDVCTDLPQAVRQICRVPQVRYILTSGGAPTALEGASVLRKMQLAAGNRLHIIAAGKVTRSNLDEVAEKTGLTYFHGRKIV